MIIRRLCIIIDLIKPAKVIELKNLVINFIILLLILVIRGVRIFATLGRNRHANLSYLRL